MVLGSIGWAHGEMEHHGYGNVESALPHTVGWKEREREEGTRDQM